MSKKRTALEKALGAPLAALFGLTLAYGFSACSGEGITLPPDLKDSSVDTGQTLPPDSGGNPDTGSDAYVPPNDAGADARDTGSDANPGGSTVVRIAAANLSSGNGQSYLEPGIRILKGLKPDIVAIQEFNVGTNSEKDIRTFVDAAFGTDFSYFRESGTGIPNGVISRYPMLAKGEWEDLTLPDRDFVWAKMDIPGDKDLWVISVHLKAGSGSTDEAKRGDEAKALDGLIGENIPSSDYVVMGGDFNTSSRDEKWLSTLGAKFVMTGPYPVDGTGNDKTNAPRSKPYDWVLADPKMNALATEAHVGTQIFPNGLVFDSRVYTPLADVAPAQSDDSAATGMQHMAVVRDFRIP
ncbi:endonuclease/exonuclease/phosphatase family protein [Pendulispora rubella]|uniref:Endonuclease/exonuclease/phosphatase family protein n=1 Tax=Pendulispora rubella TaxID=2741070 RepID=A0ABZ2KWZ6_9BACT